MAFDQYIKDYLMNPPSLKQVLKEFEHFRMTITDIEPVSRPLKKLPRYFGWKFCPTCILNLLCPPTALDCPKCSTELKH